MPNNVSFENRNGTLIISIGGVGSNPHGGSAGGSSTSGRGPRGGSAGDPPAHGSGNPGENRGSGLVVLGPIVIPCCGSGGTGQDGGSAGDPSTHGSKSGGSAGDPHTFGSGSAGDPHTFGSGSNSMSCGGPVVIGPIVLGGCTCGGSSTGHSSGSKAISVDPPAATPSGEKRPLVEGEAKRKSTAFVMQPQRL